MSYTTKRFAIRTVKDGKVRICGIDYVPDYKVGVDRFEGKRFAFGRYWTGDECQPFICLWGTELLFHADGEVYNKIYDDETKIILDTDPEDPDSGPVYFMWSWWSLAEED